MSAISTEPRLSGRILVVGGAGFVGGHVVRRALAHGSEQVVVVDNLLSAERWNLPDDGGIDLVVGSIADDEVLAGIGRDFDYVFHLATFHGNQNSIAQPLRDHENNLITTLKLYEHLKGSQRLRKLVYAGSGCVLAPHTYGEAAATTEEGAVPLDVDTPYQISKLVGEFHSVYYHRRHALPVVRARFQNVYGPGEILGAGEWRGTAATVWRNVVPGFVYRALKGRALPVENGGLATRDFIYVDDIVDGLVKCAIRGEAGDVYNVASGVETSILELAQLVDELTSNPASAEFRPGRDWDRSGRRFGSTEKARRVLGFEALVPIRHGLTQTIDWTRANLAAIERCVGRHADRMAADER